MLSAGTTDTLSWGDTHLSNSSASQLIAANSVVALPSVSVLGNNLTINHNDTTPRMDDYTDFGTMSFQAGSLTRKFTLKNTGTAPLTLTGSSPVTFTGGNATDFSILSQPTGSIAPGESKTFEVRFDPSATGLRQTTLLIASNDPTNPNYRFTIRGTGGLGNFLGFNQTPANDLRTVTTIQGTGIGAQWGTSLKVDYTGRLLDGSVFDTSLQTGRTPFDVTLATSSVIDGWHYGLYGMKLGETRTLIIPPSLGYGSTPRSGIPANSWLVFEVTARAITYPNAQLRGNNNLTISHNDTTPSLTDGTDFGNASTRGQVTQNFTLRNAGPTNTDLYIPSANQFSITGAHKDDFTVGSITSNSNGDYVIPVTFKPTAVGKRNATITLNSFDPTKPQYKFAVTGTGVAPTVTISSPDGSAGETLAGQAANLGTFRISTGDAVNTRDLAVNFTTSGTATRGDLPNGDYQLKVGDTVLPSTTRTITIPAGQSFVDVIVVPLDDTKVEPTETVIMNLGTGTTYALPTQANQRTATVNIIDNEPTVSIVTTDPQAGERLNLEEAAPGVFRISRVGVTNTNLVVNFSVSGSATRGTLPTSDYVLKVGDTVLTANSVTLPIGVEFVDVTVEVADDTRVEPTETVTLTLSALSTYSLTSNTAQRTATVNIADNEPLLKVVTIDDQGREKLNQAGVTDDVVFRVVREGVTNVPVTFDFAFGGAATRGFNGSGDYRLLINDTPVAANLNRFTMPAGDEVVEFRLVPVDDGMVERDEAISFELRNGSTYSLSTNTNERRGQAVLRDLAEPIVSVQITDNSVSERNATTTGRGVFRFTRSGGDITQPVTIKYALTGTATTGDDYTGLTGEVTIAAGVSFADVTLTPVDDVIPEGNETVVLTIQPDSAYRVRPGQLPVTMTIADWEVAPESINGLTAVGNITFGTGDFANRGTFRILLGSSDDIYLIQGDGRNVGHSIGQFTYIKTASDQAQLFLNDDILGEYRVDLTFTSPTAAQYQSVVGSTVMQRGSIALQTVAQNLVPANLNWRTLQSSITGGAGELASTGRFNLVVGSNTYQLIGTAGSILPTNGTYTYERFNNSAAVIEFDDDNLGSGIMVLRFTNSTTAEYGITLFDPSTGWQTGTVRLV